MLLFDAHYLDQNGLSWKHRLHCNSRLLLSIKHQAYRHRACVGMLYGSL